MREEERKQIVAALDDAREEIRYHAVGRLGGAFDPPPIPFLLKALGDCSWRVRKRAVEISLEKLRSQEGLAALVQALGDDENAGLRNSATEVLIQIGPVAIPELILGWSARDKDIRKFVVDIMGEIGDPRAAPHLVDALKDPDENVRAASVEALGKLGHRPIVSRLLDMLRSDGLIVQLSCLDALDRLGNEVPFETLRALMHIRPLRPYLYKLLGSLRDPGVLLALVDGLQARGRNERSAAIKALAKQYSLADKPYRVELRVSVTRNLNATLTDHLRSMLQSASLEEREAAVVVLGWIGNVDTVPDMLPLVADEKLRDPVFEAIVAIGPKVVDVLCNLIDALSRCEKVLAIEVLGHFKAPSCLTHVIDLSMSDDPEVMEAANQALVQIANPSMIENLLGLLKRNGDSPPEGLVAAMIGLGQRFHDEVVAGVRPLLEDKRSALRVTAAEILCGIARKVELEDVTRLVGDEDPQVRKVAVRVLGRVGGDEAHVLERLRMALVDESPEVRAEAARALRNRDSPGVVNALKVALGDKEPWVLREAIISLGRTGMKDVPEIILPFVGHPEGAVALEAVRALGLLDWSGSPDELESACHHQDPEVIKEVIALCDRWEVDEVRPLLMESLNDPHWDVRISAVRKIAALKDPISLRAVVERLQVEQDDLVKETIIQFVRQGGILEPGDTGMGFG